MNAELDLVSVSTHSAAQAVQQLIAHPVAMQLSQAVQALQVGSCAAALA